jgi:hypothetical protein
MLLRLPVTAVTPFYSLHDAPCPQTRIKVKHLYNLGSDESAWAGSQTESPTVMGTIVNESADSIMTLR